MASRTRCTPLRRRSVISLCYGISKENGRGTCHGKHPPRVNSELELEHNQHIRVRGPNVGKRSARSRNACKCTGAVGVETGRRLGIVGLLEGPVVSVEAQSEA